MTEQDDEATVRLANEEFYRALTKMDIEAMDEVWSHDDGARCIHPGWDIIEGWEEIRQSWEVIFGNSADLQVTPSEVKIGLEGEMAWVSCLESITARGDDTDVTLARATNLFMKKSGAWKMILHHVSQVPPEGDDEDDLSPTIH